MPLNSDSHRPLQKCYGYNQPLLFASFNQDPLEASQRATLKTNPLASFQKGPRFGAKTGIDSCSDGIDLRLFDRGWEFSDADEMQYSGDR